MQHQAQARADDGSTGEELADASIAAGGKPSANDLVLPGKMPSHIFTSQL